MADIRAKPGTLAAISRWSGGQVFSPSQNDTNAISIAMGGARPSTLDYRKTPLWDRAWWLAIFIGLLSVEWAVSRCPLRWWRNATVLLAGLRPHVVFAGELAHGIEIAMPLLDCQVEVDAGQFLAKGADVELAFNGAETGRDFVSVLRVAFGVCRRGSGPLSVSVPPET